MKDITREQKILRIRNLLQISHDLNSEINYYSQDKLKRIDVGTDNAIDDDIEETLNRIYSHLAELNDYFGLENISRFEKEYRYKTI